MENAGRLCAFARESSTATGNYSCIAKRVDFCTGYNTGCNFYKTQAQHTADTDKAIEKCRENGACASCKYRTGKPCLTSYERRN